MQACFLIESYSSDMTRYLNFLISLRNSGVGAKSRARYFVTIRGFCRFLVEEKVIKNDSTKIIDLPKSGTGCAGQEKRCNGHFSLH